MDRIIYDSNKIPCKIGDIVRIVCCYEDRQFDGHLAKIVTTGSRTYSDGDYTMGIELLEECYMPDGKRWDAGHDLDGLVAWGRGWWISRNSTEFIKEETLIPEVENPEEILELLED